MGNWSRKACWPSGVSTRNNLTLILLTYSTLHFMNGHCHSSNKCSAAEEKQAHSQLQRLILVYTEVGTHVPTEKICRGLHTSEETELYEYSVGDQVLGSSICLYKIYQTQRKRGKRGYTGLNIYYKWELVTAVGLTKAMNDQKHFSVVQLYLQKEILTLVHTHFFLPKVLKFNFCGARKKKKKIPSFISVAWQFHSFLISVRHLSEAPVRECNVLPQPVV